MEKIIKILFNLFRVLVGALFVFSGFVKGVDPMGSMIKFNEYFAAAHIPHNDSVSLIFSILLSTAEFLIGVALLTGIFMKLTARTALYFMLFFLILTFLLAWFNPVTDCGCFGDAIKLTNWETFYKNLILIVPVLFIFVFKNNYSSILSKSTQWIIGIITVVAFVWLSVYSLRHLPVIDFMPYSVGSNIPDKMAIPKGAPQDEYATTLLYKKDGVVKEFAMDSIPWKDTTWKWVETRSKLVKKGYVPPIHDFSIFSGESNLTDLILNDTTITFILVASNINKSNSNGLKAAQAIADYCSASGNAKFIALTSSVEADLNKIKSLTGISYQFHSADETMLKTMIRANPGIILLKKGTVLGKWHYNDFKKIDYQNPRQTELALTHMRKASEDGWAYSFLAILGFVIVSVSFLVYYIKTSR